ncbi:MAG: GNAT family N-acetyltransferase [Burkholderiales bacterium]|nr:GNAT family N-acetyltransferase [Burkholderiales bacterium]
MMKTRLAIPTDAPAIARIYNQGIEDRVATFETEPRSAADVQSWFTEQYTLVVVEDGDDIVAFAATFPYRTRECYAGVREFSVYVDRSARGKGAGRVAMERLIEESRRRGDWKLLSRVFPENTASLKLLRNLGFREVGTYKNHARLDGEWRDVVIVELLLNQ